jgi:hypothetical protein
MPDIRIVLLFLFVAVDTSLARARAAAVLHVAVIVAIIVTAVNAATHGSMCIWRGHGKGITIRGRCRIRGRVHQPHLNTSVGTASGHNVVRMRMIARACRSGHQTPQRGSHDGAGVRTKRTGCRQIQRCRRGVGKVGMHASVGCTSQHQHRMAGWHGRGHAVQRGACIRRGYRPNMTAVGQCTMRCDNHSYNQNREIR